MNPLEEQELTRRRFPWPSSLALLYPLAAAIWVWNQASVDPRSSENALLLAVSYGISQLGYVLLGAGIFARTFRIFGLTKRWQTILAGGAVWLVGAVLFNVLFNISS